MYKRVVVTLDGSKLAEIVLPHLMEIARGCSIPEVWLVSVTEPLNGKISGIQAEEYSSGSDYHTPDMQSGTSYSGLVISSDSSQMRDVPVALGKMTKAALNYLSGVAQQLEEKGLKARAKVLIGNPAEQIVSFTEDQHVDLIIMATRGRGGFSRFAFGSVAEKVVRATEIPVILVNPPRDFKESKPHRKGTPS